LIVRLRQNNPSKKKTVLYVSQKSIGRILKSFIIASVILLFFVDILFALLPDRRRDFEQREENVYMALPIIASIPGAGVFGGMLGSFSNIAGTGIDAAIVEASTFNSEADIHIRAWAFKELPLYVPGLTLEYWFGDINFSDYQSYLPGRDSPKFTIPSTGKIKYNFLRPALRLFKRRFNMTYNLVFFKGFAVNGSGEEEEIAQHSASGNILLDFTDDVIDPKIGLRLSYTNSMKAPESSFLGKNSSNESGFLDDIETRQKEIIAYIPFTDQFTLVAFNQIFEAIGGENSGDVISGGSLSLRGYPGGRWSDRYGETRSLEGRYTVPTNLDLDIYIVHGLLEGIQFAAFYETGQVAPDKDNRLYEDLHRSYGVGVRLLLEAIVLRADIADSDEGIQTHITIDQPF